MPIISKHLPGAFCWTDLVTTDSAGAKRFYSELFGWEVEEMGSRSCVPPTDISDVGRFSMLFDPQGTIFATLQPAPM